MVDGNVELPHRRLLQVGIDQVDVGRRLSAHRELRLVVRVGRELRQIGRAARQSGRTAAEGGDLQAVVGERVGQPDRSGGTLEQAETAAQLSRAFGIEAVVEAEARLKQLVAVDGGVVADAEVVEEALVEARPAADFRNIQSHAEQQVQVVGGGPAVLQEEAVVLERELRCSVVDVVAVGLAEGEVAEDAVAEILQAAEPVVAQAGFDEQVEDVVVFVVDAEPDGVVAGVVVTLEEDVQGFGAQHVCVAELLGTEANRLTAEVDANGRQARLVVGHRIEVAVGDLELGREVVGPIGVELTNEGLEHLVLGIPVRGQRQRVVVEVRQDDGVFFGTVVAEAGALEVGDVPVELDQNVLDFRAQAGDVQGAGIEAPDVAGDADQIIDVSDRDVADGIGGVAADRAKIGTGRLALEVFVVDQEEQLVLDKRAAERGAIGGLIFEAGERLIVATIADHRVVAIDENRAAFELVGAGLGHRVDVGAGVAGLGYVVVGDVDLNFFDRVDRDRLLGRRQVVGLEAEGIVGGGSVDGDRVEPDVLANRGNFAALLVGLRDARIQAGVILQVALD